MLVFFLHILLIKKKRYKAICINIRIIEVESGNANESYYALDLFKQDSGMSY